jgi:hypothetical protein
MFATLVDPQTHEPVSRKNDNLIGSYTSSIHKLKDINNKGSDFPDLSDPNALDEDGREKHPGAQEIPCSPSCFSFVSFKQI